MGEIRTFGDDVNIHGAVFDMTQPAREYARRQGYEEGYYKGYHIIGRDTSINGGVYILEGEVRESIIVDDRSDGGWLQQNYDWLLNRCKAVFSTNSSFSAAEREWILLQESLTLAQQRIPASKQQGDRFILPDEPGKLVHLREFAGGGLCRHQALLCGYFVERLIKERYLSGTVSVRRSRLGDSAHAWCEYRKGSDASVVLDPMKQDKPVFPKRLPITDRGKNFYDLPAGELVLQSHSPIHKVTPERPERRNLSSRIKTAFFPEISRPTYKNR